MKLNRGLCCIILLPGILLINFNSPAQRKHTGLKAYLILNNQDNVISKDSLFEHELRSKVGNLLKKKHIILVSNEETETYGQTHLYIKIEISDSLRISDWKSSATDGNVVLNVIPRKKAYLYSDEADIINKVTAYIKKNI